MTLTLLQQAVITPSISLSYVQAIAMKQECKWEALGDLTVGEILEEWLATLASRHTERSYRSAMRQLITAGHVNPVMPLQAFALVAHNSVVDNIKHSKQEQWSENTKQARAAAYIAFTGFLCRRSEGMIPKAMPCKEGVAKTFYQVYEKVKTEAMVYVQYTAFVEAIKNERDQLIARVVLQGGKRINEVLTLTTEQICWAKNEITFTQSKTRGKHREIVITYAPSIMNALKAYIGDRQGLVFITSSGKKVPLIQLATTFDKAGIKTNIPFKVTPHVLRATAVTELKRLGYSDSDVAKITGHSLEMVRAYDKTDRADNVSKRVNLIL